MPVALAEHCPLTPVRFCLSHYCKGSRLGHDVTRQGEHVVSSPQECDEGVGPPVNLSLVGFSFIGMRRKPTVDRGETTTSPCSDDRLDVTSGTVRGLLAMTTKETTPNASIDSEIRNTKPLSSIANQGSYQTQLLLLLLPSERYKARQRLLWTRRDRFDLIRETNPRSELATAPLPSLYVCV